MLSLYSAPFDVTKLPFVNVATLLAKMPVPIPEVLGHADDLGVLALQDLGDVTLQAHLGAASPAEHAALYRQAVALIATLQRRGEELASPDYLPYGISFDVEKLTWELDFFTKHFLEAYRGVTLGDDQRAALREEFAVIVRELAAEPPRALPSRLSQPQPDAARVAALHHRLPGRAHGARHLRPRVAAARFLRRSARSRRSSELIAYFLALKGVTGEDPDFRRRFDVMALQRNLKALGTFGYQTTARRNPVYIQYIPRTLRYVRDNLDNQPRFDRLRDLLADLRRRIPVNQQAPTYNVGLARWPVYNERFPVIELTVTMRFRDFHAPLSRSAAEPGPPGADRGARVRGGGGVRDPEPLRLPRPGGDRAARRMAEGDRARAARHPRADRREHDAAATSGATTISNAVGDTAKRQAAVREAGRRAEHRAPDSGRRVRRPPRDADARRAARTTAPRRSAASRKSAGSPSRSASASRWR